MTPCSRKNVKVVWQKALSDRDREHKSAQAWVNDIMVESKDG
jgi:hypothetical protein